MRDVSPARYRTVVAVAGFFLAIIVVTGAAVRLTQSGLGCEDWPACTSERFVPEFALHPWIEFGNRLLSGLVAVAVAVAVLTAYRRTPRRSDLITLAWGLVVGVVAQILLGAITVRFDLHPAIVGAHFLLSMVLLANAALLWVRAGSGPGPAVAAVDRGRLNHGRVLVALATVVLVTGTLVTGTGPNSGDSRAERLSFDLSAIARVHSVTVWCFVAVTVLLALRLRQGPSDGFRLVQWLLAVSVAQGAVGYVQFANGVPALLVGFHVVGAMAVWVLAILLYLSLFRRRAIELPEPVVATGGVNPAAVLGTMNS